MSVFYGNPVWIPRIAQRQPYLEFTADGEFCISTSEKHWDGSLYYSTDKSTWYEWDSAAIYSDNMKLYLRGTGNTIITGQPNGVIRRFEFELYAGTSIECSGSIETLLDWETYVSGNHPTMGAYAFAQLFEDCTVLSKAPELTSASLNRYCYDRMFSGCISLTIAPELSAMTLAESCYYQMFYGCTSLVAPPALPATTLDIKCYNYMFYGCTSLTTAPELPATTLPAACYTMMFGDCTSLKFSTTQSAIYQYSYRIPPRGEGTNPEGAMMYMFYNTGGTFTGTPTINTTYYTDHEPVAAI